MTFNYQKICSNLLSDLSERTRDVIVRRFGLDTGKRETLESIGTSYGITREIAEMMYEGFQELWQLPTDSRTYECRGGGFGGSGRATDITSGGRKGYFVNMRTNLGDSYKYLESIVSEELGLVTPPLTPKDVRTKKLVGKSWAELTDKSKKYYDKLTEEGFYKYLLPY